MKIPDLSLFSELPVLAYIAVDSVGEAIRNWWLQIHNQNQHC